MVHLPIALQLFSVRDDMAADFAGTLKKVKAFGYDGVEFAGLHGLSVDEVKAALTDAGLEAVSAHVALPELLADPAGTVAKYKAIGCKWITIPYLPDEYRAHSGNFFNFIEFVKVLGAEAKKQGLTLLYHNHDFEFVKIDGEYCLDVLYSSVSADLLQTQLDTCWVNVGGENPVEYVKKYSGRAPLVHLKDFVGSKSENMYQLIGKDDKAQADTVKSEAFAFRPVGYGVQDIPAIVEAGEAAGAHWFIVEQDMPALDKTPMECAKMSVEYLKSLK